jgi:hypothetical protein
LAVVACLIGTSRDTWAYGAAATIATCVSRPDNTTAYTIEQYASKVYGKSGFFDEARDCYLKAFYNNKYKVYNCFCTTPSGTCYNYDSSTGDCSKLYGPYKTTLGATVAFDAMLIMFVLWFSCTGCGNLVRLNCEPEERVPSYITNTARATAYIVDVPAQPSTQTSPPQVALVADGLKPVRVSDPYANPVPDSELNQLESGPLHLTTAFIAEPALATVAQTSAEANGAGDVAVVYGSKPKADSE